MRALNLINFYVELIVPYNCNFKGLRTTKTYGDRAFTTAAPTVCNRLPQTIRLCYSSNSFKTLLKTHLFQKVYTC